jgi:prolyl-tRNA synthetase
MPKAFYRFINDARIALTEFPVTGTNILLPYGHAICRNLENYLLDGVRNRGYEEIDLPEIVPHNFLAHLRQEELFTVKAPEAFSLAPGTESQAAFYAKRVVRDHRDLPLRMFARGKYHRFTSKKPLIKDLEFRLCELHGFFADHSRCVKERDYLLEYFESQFRKIGIPTIRTSDAHGDNSQRKIYAHFPGFGSFGSIFCATVVGDRYVAQFNIGFRDEAGSKKMPEHLNAGFTGRILAAYLANHMDERGFRLEKPILPFDVYVSERGFDHESLDRIKKVLTDANIRYSARDEGLAEAYLEFHAQGMPVMIGCGKHAISIRSRHTKGAVWIKEEHLVSEVLGRLERKPVELEDIRIQPLPSAKTELRDNVVYTEDTEPTTQLKRLGMLADGRIAYVLRKI